MNLTCGAKHRGRSYSSPPNNALLVMLPPDPPFVIVRIVGASLGSS